MHPKWPPASAFDERHPWPAVLPGRAEKGFPAGIGVGGLGHPDVMAAMWCRATLEDAHAYYQRARQAAWANWAIERMEDWSPTESLLGSGPVAGRMQTSDLGTARPTVGSKSRS